MKLAFLGDAIEMHLFRWARSFVGLGHEVHVITWNTQVLDGYHPAVVHRVAKPMVGDHGIARGINLFRMKPAIQRLIREIKPDLIHAHGAGAYAWMAMFSGFRPFMITPWGSDVLIDVNSHAIARFFTKRAVRRADWLHCEGENTKEALVCLGADPRKILVMPFGVDLEKFAPGERPCGFIERHGLAGTKVVVSTRTLNPIHDVETVVRAASLVLQKEPDVRFLIVGDGTERTSLRNLAESLGIGGSLVFVGRVKEEEMVDCLRASDVYVSTSLSESGTALSTAEAMACGLPVINTDTGDIRMWLKDGEGGYVVPVRNPTAIAGRILHLMHHADERERAGKMNRQLMEDRYDVRVMMQQMEALYGRLITQQGARGVSP